jgi:beta-galactosidase
MALQINDGKFHLNDIPVLLIGGSVHYWRLDRALWSQILDKVKEMGFETICTYVPWSVHELARGQFDFGESNPSYDLEAFLFLCEEKNLNVLLRPGPHVNSEITYFGFPKRIVLDPEIQSVTAEGTPVVFPSPPRMFPVPGYASEKF